MNQTLKGLKKLKADLIFLKLRLTLQTEDYSKDENDLYSFHYLNGKKVDIDTLIYLKRKAEEDELYLTEWKDNIVLSTNDFYSEKKKEKREITSEEIKDYVEIKDNLVTVDFNGIYNNEQNIGGKK